MATKGKGAMQWRNGMGRYPALLVLLLGMAGCAAWPRVTSDAKLQPVGAAELSELLVGNTLYRRNTRLFSDWEYANLHHAYGVMTAQLWWSDGEELAEGRWEVTADSLYCRIWQNNWGDGKQGCFGVSRDGDLLIFDHVSGSRGDADRYVYQWQPGNPFDL